MKFIQIFIFLFVVHFSHERILKKHRNIKIKESKKADIFFDQNKPQIVIQPHGNIHQAKSNTANIRFGKVPEIDAKAIQKNYPLLQIDEKGGLEKFGAIAQDLFKMNPEDILGKNEMQEKLDDFKESLDESKMKYPILIPPTILKSMVFYLNQIDEFKKKEKEEEETKNKDQNSPNLTKEQMQEKQIEERMQNNEKDIKTIENQIKIITDKISGLRAEKKHREEVKQQEEELAKLEREKKAEQKKQAILVKEQQVEEDLIKIEKEEINLENQDVSVLEEEKQKLEKDLQDLINQENSSEKIAEIEKALEKIDELIRQKQEDIPQNQKEQLMKEQEDLILQEQEETQKIMGEEIQDIEGDMNSTQMKLAKQQIIKLKELLEILIQKLPKKNKLVYKNDNQLYLKILIDIHNFQRLFKEYEKFCHKTVYNFQEKLRQVELTTDGIVKYVEKNDQYIKIRKNTYPDDAKIFNWDSKLELLTNKLSEIFKLLISNLNSINRSFTAINAILDNSNIEEEKNVLFQQEETNILEEDFNKKKDIVFEIDDLLNESFNYTNKVQQNIVNIKEFETEIKLILTQMNDYINEKENILTQEKKERDRKEKINEQIEQQNSSQKKTSVLLFLLVILL